MNLGDGRPRGKLEPWERRLFYFRHVMLETSTGDCLSRVADRSEYDVLIWMVSRGGSIAYPLGAMQA